MFIQEFASTTYINNNKINEHRPLSIISPFIKILENIIEYGLRKCV